MGETAKVARLVRFGTFEVDLRSAELRKAGVKLKLTGQPFQVLTILLEHPGEVVTREELQKRLWPNTFVDGDHNLTAINKIREVLGDSAENPRFIETLPRRGYRFLCEVEAAHPDVQSSLQNPQVQPAVAKGFRYVIGWVAPFLLICNVAFFYFRNSSQSPAFYSSVPLTHYVGSEICPSFAPDGERVAFAWDGEKQGNFDIYVKQIGDGTLLRLTSDPKPDVSPAWSPDGRTIAFLRLNSDGGVMGLFLLSVETGENYLDHGQGRELTRIPSDRFNWVPSPDGTELAIFLSQHGIRFLSLDTGVARDVSIDDWPLSNGDWSADGKSLFVPSFTSRATPVILDVNEAGKAVVVLEGDANTGFWWMIQSPDGRHGMLEADVPGDNNAWMIENF